MIKISPSVLACDLSQLSRAAVQCEQAGADMLHLDVMDGHFVNNISFGAPVIASLRNKTELTFDVHLMIEHPEKYVRSFISAGADIVTFHLEAVNDAGPMIDIIRENGAAASIAVKPSTPVEAVFPYLPRLAMVLIMTVEPGFGGQSFIPETLPKIRALSEECARRSLDMMIETDGGINPQTARLAAAAGANVFVAGSYIFASPDMRAAMDSIRCLRA